ncbi:MAG: cyclic nucleotide-binding domain-containing protein [Spirochaetes bacterium]|nr:MAG: cyclic nucleotide-binding domain-containing protein [Spirochaetota bacterium]
MEDKEKILGKLKEITLFEEIKNNDEYMQLLLDVFKLKHFREGETIITEGEVGDEMYIVYRGGVEILKKTRAGDYYTVIKLRAEDNVYFGEMALIDNDKRSATVTASEDSDFLVIKKDDFLKMGNSYPQIGLPITRNIAKILAGRLRKTTTDMLTIFDALVNEIRE